MTKKAKSKKARSPLTVNGVQAEVLIGNLFHVASIWGKVKPTKANINKHGFEIISDFFRALNMRPVFQVIHIKQKRQKK